MKKLILLIVIFAFGILFADFDLDIPFDTNIIGDDFSIVGEYNYVSEWMTVTNTGTAVQTYTFTYHYDNLPAGWYMTVCNPEFCFMADWPVPIELQPGESELLHISVNVISTGGFPFNFTFSGGDIPEPISIDFTFNTEDNVGVNDELLALPKLGQNYPNPFNPSTKIALNLTADELTSAQLRIFNTKGQIVKTFTQLAEEVIWDGTNNSGNTVNSGIYLYQLKTNAKIYTKRMILLK